MSESDGTNPMIIVRRGRRAKHGHHGGSWKVAYADFVTAMMAFFLVMWLLGVATTEQRAAVSEYFKNPSMTPGTATLAPPGQMGPGGASDSAIDMGGGMNRSHGAGDQRNSAAAKATSEQAQKEAREKEHARLEELMVELNAAIEQSQALAPFKDQLMIDITPDGLRIQIIDKLNRPMFDTGSASLKAYTEQILIELGRLVNDAPNRITLSGHTDDTPYSSDLSYSNWELSADRANAARRALIRGGLADAKIARVIGLAAAVPFDRAKPGDASNRRISIMLMTKQAEDAALSQGLATSNNPPVVTPLPTTQASLPTVIPVHASGTLIVKPVAPGPAP